MKHILRRRRRSGLGCRAVGAGVAMVTAIGAAQIRAAVVPTFNNASALAATHDPDGPGGTSGAFSPMSLPTGSATLMAPFGSAGNVITFPGGTTKAKAGAGRSQGSNSARITFPTGMGIDQTDPSHVQPKSTLSVNFQFIWDIVGGTLGPPTNAGFSVPIGAKVGPGGLATLKTDIHWDAVQNGVVDFDRRAPYVSTHNFGPGTTLTSITAPSAPFSPSSIPDGPGVDQIIVRGSLLFEVNNDEAPSIIEVLGRLESSQGKFNSFFAQELMDNPEYQYEAGAGFADVEEVPEPTTTVLLTAGTGLLAVRRRRQ